MRDGAGVVREVQRVLARPGEAVAESELSAEELGLLCRLRPGHGVGGRAYKSLSLSCGKHQEAL